MSGTLYVVATPIGNLDDMTLRALKVLKSVKLIACEDTRHSRKLLSHFGIGTPLTAYHEHNESTKAPQLVQKLLDGQSLALITDAGTPGISDPGYRLVRACQQAGIAVQALPGASAVVAALSVSGISGARFAFEGFLPARKNARRDMLTRLALEERTLVFYEAPHRLLATLADVVELLGAQREVSVVRELTKVHEEVVRGTSTEVLEVFSGRERVRGELVIVVAPAEAVAPQESVAEVLRRRLAESDRPPRQVVKEVARQLGIPGSEVYQEYLRQKSKG